MGQFIRAFFLPFTICFIIGYFNAKSKYKYKIYQVIKYKGLYYGYYHATAFKDWHEWSTNIAVSADLIHWKKYANNPIIGNNQSSGIVVIDGKNIQFYTMHRKVNMFLPK